jgi:PAS domain S-box-containing protein
VPRAGHHDPANTQSVAVQTEEQSRASEATFRALAESAPAAIFVCQGDRIRYCNPAAMGLTGYSREELSGRSFSDTAAPDCRDSLTARAAARRRGEPVPARFELSILTKSGAQRALEFTETPFEFAGPGALLGVAFDVTERKQAEDAVRGSQQLLNEVLATLPVGVAVTDREGDIILGNAALRRIWGDLWGSVRALSKRPASLNELIDIESFTGERRTIQNSAAPIRNAEGQTVGTVIVNEDVTERVRAEEALHESADRLQHLSRRLLAVQEEERRHLARELHDEFGQLLTSITLHLQAAKNAAGSAAQPSLNEGMALLQRAGTQMRSLALELRPMLLETAGLDATLRWLAAQHEQRTGVVSVVVGHVTDLSGEVAIACFRVVQEALTNVARHAAARHVWIELTQSQGLLGVVIRDDGVGFDVRSILERAAAGTNLGLVGMRERVEILGGQLAIESRPEQGTRIHVSFPLAEPAAAPVPQMA